MRSSSASGAPITRRELLAAVGGAGVVSSRQSAELPLGDASIHVRVYPRLPPMRVRLRRGLEGLRDDWAVPYRDALAAVDDAVEQVLEYARERSRLGWGRGHEREGHDVDVRVERGAPIRLPVSAVEGPVDAVLPSLETVIAGFRRRLRERDALTGSTCHLLLCWSPLNYRVGYGGTLSPNARLGDAGGGSTGDALTVANVGATEVWDSRAVTRNIAIHEVLHTLLADDVVASVVDSRCDHDLGSVERIDAETMQVSPMATAYAGPDEIGGGTRFHGTGCYDHDRFHRHDGLEGVDEWAYTTDLSPATLEAVTRFLEGWLAP